MSWTLVDSYKLYKDEVQDPFSKELYLKLFKQIFYELSLAIIRDRITVRIPYALGYLRINKSKVHSNTQRRKIDNNLKKQKGMVIYHDNRHTNGYFFFWDWNSKKARFANRKLYEFKATRGNDYIIGTRGLAKWIKDCHDDPYKKDYDVIEQSTTR